MSEVPLHKHDRLACSPTEAVAEFCAQALRAHAPLYRGTSIIRNSAPLGPYRRTMGRTGFGVFL